MDFSRYTVAESARELGINPKNVEKCSRFSTKEWRVGWGKEVEHISALLTLQYVSICKIRKVSAVKVCWSPDSSLIESSFRKKKKKSFVLWPLHKPLVRHSGMFCTQMQCPQLSSSKFVRYLLYTSEAEFLGPRVERASSSSLRHEKTDSLPPPIQHKFSSLCAKQEFRGETGPVYQNITAAYGTSHKFLWWLLNWNKGVLFWFRPLCTAAFWERTDKGNCLMVTLPKQAPKFLWVFCWSFTRPKLMEQSSTFVSPNWQLGLSNSPKLIILWSAWTFRSEEGIRKFFFGMLCRDWCCCVALKIFERNEDLQ